MDNNVNSLQYLIQIALDKQGAKLAQDELKKMGDEALTSARKIDSSYKQVDQSITANTKFTKDGAVTIQKMSQTLQDSAGKQVVFTHSVLQSADSVQRLDESSKALVGTMSRSKDGVAGLIEGYGKLAVRALAVVPIWALMRSALGALSGTFNDTVQSMIKIDSALAKLKNEFAVGEVIGTGIEDAKKQAEDLATQFGVSAEEAILSARQFKTSGLDITTALAGMNTAMRASVATGESSDEISKTLADTYNLMGDRITGVSGAADKMNFIMGAMLTLMPNNSVSFKEFTDALRTFLGTAGNVNLTLQETLALVAVTGTGMQRGARGGTQLASAFNQLAQKGKEVKDFIGDTRGLSSFEQMIRILEKAQSISKEGGEIQTPIAEIFGLKGGRAVSADIALLDQFLAQLKQLNGLSLKDFNEEFEKRVGNSLGTIESQLKRLKQIREDLGRNFLSGLFGVDTENSPAKALDEINNRLEKMKGLATDVGEAFRAAGIIAKVGGGLALGGGLLLAGRGALGLAAREGLAAQTAATRIGAPAAISEEVASGFFSKSTAKFVAQETAAAAAQSAALARAGDVAFTALVLKGTTSFKALGEAGVGLAKTIGITGTAGVAFARFATILSGVVAAGLVAGKSLEFFFSKVNALKDVTEAANASDKADAEAQKQFLILNELKRQKLGLPSAVAGTANAGLALNLPGTGGPAKPEGPVNLDLEKTRLKPSEELELQLRAVERLKTLGLNQAEIEKLKLDLLVKQGAEHDEIVKQAQKFINVLHSEVEAFSDLLRGTTEKGLSDIFQGKSTFADLTKNVSEAMRKGFADALAGNITDQIFKATGIGELFGGIFSNIRHANDGVKGIIIGAHETGAGIVKKALLEAFTQGAAIIKGDSSGVAGFSGIPGLNSVNGIPGLSSFGKNGLTLPGFGQGGFFSRTVGGPAAMTGANGQLLTAAGNPVGATFGAVGGAALGAGLLGFSQFQAAGGSQGSLAIPAGALGSLGGAALGLSSLGFGAAAGASAGAAALAPLLGPIGIALLAGSFLFSAFSKTKQTSIDEKTANQQVASRVDVTNKKLDLVNRNLVALKSVMETYILPESAYFSTKVNLEDNFAVDSRR